MDSTEKQEEIIEEVVADEDVELVDEASLETESDKDQEELTNEETVEDFESMFIKKDKEVVELTNKLHRNMAEFDNFRKRTIKEKSAMYENGSKVVLEKMLPIIDNFERAIESSSKDCKDDAFAEGVNMIYKQLLTTMLDLGVEAIDAAGAEFDPNLHHAVSHEENDEYGENVVVNELQKGYMFNDKVLRHSMVTVAN